MNQAHIIPWPRDFKPSHQGSFSSMAVTVRESIVPRLGFEPRHVPDEAYELILDPAGIELRALSANGLRHARTSLAALQAADNSQLPAGTIQDEPRFAWRGFMLDCSRHFYPVAEIKRILNRLGRLKFNRFHWHLVDDQGWRLEIPALPKLTEIGAWRTTPDGKRHGGFYSTRDVTEIVAHAAALLPESYGADEVPALTAAVAAMTARH